MSGLYSQGTIDRVRESVDIVSIISSYLPLKKSGANHVALCPFHNEKTPSFSVNQSKQIFHCFGCGEGGNVITFVMKYENMPFTDALQLLADRGGVTLPKKKTDESFARIYEVNHEAADFYRSRLQSIGGAAAAYLKKRGLSDDVRETFSVGYAPDAWDACLKHLRSKNFAPQDVEKAGLVKRSSSGNLIDRFRNRLVFPVFDQRNHVIAFGGRSVDPDQEPKYLNSPESPVYHKGQTIYGLNLSADTVRKSNQVLVVEGYMDLLALWQADIRNVVATAGTAFTPQQCRLLKRYTENIVMIFDGDEAGLKAASRATKVALELNVRPRVAVLPAGQDPDDLIRSASAEAFLKIVEQAKPYVAYLIHLACRKYDIATPEGRADAARSLLPELSAIEDPIERASYVQDLAEKVNIPAEKIEARLKRSRTGNATRNAMPRQHDEKRPEEKMLVRIALDAPALLTTKLAELTPDDFRSPLYRSMFDAIRTATAEGAATARELIDAQRDEDLQRRLRELAMENKVYDPELMDKIVADNLERIRLRGRKTLIEEMRRAVDSGKREEYLEHQKRFRK